MMRRDDFLKELEELLADLEAEELEEVLHYYRDLFAEAGPEKEEEILRHLGDPMKVAAEIREGLQGSPDAGEFTERGYRDERFDDDYLAPERYAGNGFGEGRTEEDNRRRRTAGEAVPQGSAAGKDASESRAEKRRNGLLLLVLFLVFGLPIAGSILSAGFSAAAGLLGCVLGILGGLFGLVFGGFVTAGALVVSGILCVIVGMINLTAPAMGLMVMCFGFLMLAAAMLLTVAAKWGCTTAIPGVFRFSIDLIRSVCGWIGRVIRRMFGRGGEAA